MHYRIAFTNEQIIWEKAQYLQSHPFVFYFLIKEYNWYCKSSIQLFKCKHLTIWVKPTSTLDASYAPAMQIKTDNSTPRAASASVFTFTFSVPALLNSIRGAQVHSAAVQGGKGPSLLPAVPPHVLRRETASGSISMSEDALHFPAARSTDDRRSPPKEKPPPLNYSLPTPK